MNEPWPVQAVSTLSSGRTVCLLSEVGGAYVARITGTDAKFKWARRFFKLFPQGPWEGRAGRGAVSYFVRFSDLGPLPCALDVRWGPRDEVTGKCSLRGYFFAAETEPYLWPVDEVQVRGFVGLDVLVRPASGALHVVRAHTRAPILFDEEV